MAANFYIATTEYNIHCYGAFIGLFVCLIFDSLLVSEANRRYNYVPWNFEGIISEVHIIITPLSSSLAHVIQCT